MKKWTRVRLMLGVSLGLSLPAAAQSQIFYNEKLDAQAKTAVTEYQAMRDAHLAMFREREAAIKALSKRVDDAVVAGVQAERDREIVRVLSPAKVDGDDGRTEELRELLKQRIRHISGVVPEELIALRAATADPASRLIYTAGIDVTGLQRKDPVPEVAPTLDEANAIRLMGTRHRFFADRQLNGEAFTYARYCRDTVVKVMEEVARAPDQAGRTRLHRAFEAVLEAEKIPAADAQMANYLLQYKICGPIYLAKQQGDFLTAAGATNRYHELKALAGIGLADMDVTMAGAGPAIDLGLNIRQLRPALQLAQAEAKVARENLSKLKAEQKKLEKAMKEGAAAEVQSSAAKIVKIIGKAPEPAAVSATLAGTGEGTGGTTQSEDPQSGSCLDEVTLACARQLAESYGLAEFDRVRESGLLEIAGLLADPAARAEAVKANCGPPTDSTSAADKAKATRICLTRSAMDLLGVGDRISDIAAGRPGELAALAVRIADAQMRVATAEARASALSRRIDNLSAQRAGLVTELNILLQGWAHLKPQTADYRIALLDFARSQDAGRLAYERASDQFTLIALNEFAAREHQVVKARYAIIDGLLGTITASTGAGLKPAELASFLSAIGVTSLGIAEISQ